ncbi:MAG: ribonuclease III [Endomicrobium sp.]|jgi:ribonuclease-3|nr:ribonuclease III [Endomicrobium sp.]
MLDKNPEKFQEVIGYKFNNLKVLVTALTHVSYVKEAANEASDCDVNSAVSICIEDYNERMEFLGDSILSAIITETLYIRYPSEPEGKLSQLKAQIVSACNLSFWAKKICLGEYIFLGKNEDSRQARKRKHLLCDVFEAVVGALYLDGGYEVAKKFILKFLESQKKIIMRDYKSKLQEITQLIYKKLPEYKIVNEFGSDHNKKFEAEVYVNSEFLGKGIGSSKKQAHQVAAEQAIRNINRSTFANDVKK